MSKAEELAQAYADAVSTHRLESLYGTSKSYTLEKSRERDEAHAALAAELRRLAQVEAEHAALKEELEAEREETKRWRNAAKWEQEIRKQAEMIAESVRVSGRFYRSGFGLRINLQERDDGSQSRKRARRLVGGIAS